MTHETKLGLVIGGAFILCFALILSHAEQDSLIPGQMAALLPSDNDPPPDGFPSLAAAPMERLTAHLPPSDEPILSPANQASSSDPDQTSAEGDQADGSRGLATTPPDRSAVFGPGSANGTTLRQSHRAAEALPYQAATGAERKHSADPPGSAAEVKDSPSGLKPQAAPSPSNESTGKPAGGFQHPRRVQVYVVAANDTLTRIARRFYGASAAEHIERIFQANRKVLADRNSLRVGQALQIPLTASTTADLPTQQPTAIPAGSNSAPPFAVTWRWYQVQPHDRYTRIAREELGSETRWKEIFELNKDVFPNPDLIKPGVRIKIPR